MAQVIEQSVAAVGRTAALWLKRLSGPPPKLYDPSIYPISGAMKRFNAVNREHGFGTAYNKARMESQFRVGYLVGQDANGNKYYENKDMPYGGTYPASSRAP